MEKAIIMLPNAERCTEMAQGNCADSWERLPTTRLPIIFKIQNGLPECATVAATLGFCLDSKQKFNSDGSCSGRCKSGIITIDEIFNDTHHIFVWTMRKQWNCKLETTPVETGPRSLLQNRCSVPVCYIYYYFQSIRHNKKMVTIESLSMIEKHSSAFNNPKCKEMSDIWVIKSNEVTCIDKVIFQLGYSTSMK